MNRTDHSVIAAAWRSVKSLRPLAVSWLVLLLALPAGHAWAQPLERHGPSWSARITSSHAPHTTPATDWSNQIIYFLLIDRFANGDTTNDRGSNPDSYHRFDPKIQNTDALKCYQGGDLQGVIDHLDYLKSLGVTALWLSPVFDNSDSAFVGWWPYHGYSPIDFFRVDEHFGTLATMQKLVRTAHKKGIKIILDMICNHVAPDHPWVRTPSLWRDAGYSLWFHPHSGVDGSTSIQNWQDQQQLEERELNGLPDLAQENGNVYDFLLDIAKFWIVQTGCDGFRLDAVKHIPKSFWQRYCRDIRAFAGPNFLLLGEVFSGDTDYVAGYADLGFSALFDIPLYYAIHQVFAQGGTVQILSEQQARSKNRIRLPLSTLIDNHDVARFSYWAGESAKDKIKTSLAYLCTQPGLPMIYYGTEIVSPGASPTNEKTGQGQDYLNRYPMDWAQVQGQHQDLVHYIGRLTSARRSHLALRKGRRIECYKDYGMYAYLCQYESELILVILNIADTPEARAIPLPPGIFSGNHLTDIMSGYKTRLDGDSVSVSLAPCSTKLFSVSRGWNKERLEQTSWQCSFTPHLSGDRRWIDLLYAPAAPVDRVTIAGDFNGWNKEANDLRFDPVKKAFRITLPLKKGRYRYKFVVNGTNWLDDPNASEYELDPYGGRNSVIIVR